MQHRNGMNKEIDSLDSGESPNNIKEEKNWCKWGTLW